MEGATAMPCDFVVACAVCHSLYFHSPAVAPGSVELRKGLDVNIASAMASEASDKTAILNCLILPRAGTKALQQEAPAAHESNLIDLWSSFPSDFLSPRAESTLTQRDHVPKMRSVSLSFCRSCETFSKLSR